MVNHFRIESLRRKYPMLAEVLRMVETGFFLNEQYIDKIHVEIVDGEVLRTIPYEEKNGSNYNRFFAVGLGEASAIRLQHEELFLRGNGEGESSRTDLAVGVQLSRVDLRKKNIGYIVQVKREGDYREVTIHETTGLMQIDNWYQSQLDEANAKEKVELAAKRLSTIT